VPVYDARIVEETKTLVQWLVKHDYDAIERRSQGVRWPGTELKRAVAEYGRTLIMPPDQAFDALDVIAIQKDNGPRAWSIRFDLWTREEGRSDLTLEITLKESEQRTGEMVLEIDNLHVL
jgi:hypothetical protein